MEALRKAAAMSGKQGSNRSEEKETPKRKKSSNQSSPAASPCRTTPKFRRGVPLSESVFCEATSPLANKLSPSRGTKIMENGLEAHVCNHDDDRTLVHYGSGHFTEKKMKQKNYPTNCVTCKRRFFQGRGKLPEGCVRVNDEVTNLVWACPNCVNHRDHPCMHAKCTGCKTGAEKSGHPKRNRRQRQLVNPGEVLEKDGGGNSVIVPEGEHNKNKRKRVAAARKNNGNNKLRKS